MKKFLIVLIALSIACFGWYRWSLLPVDSASKQRIVVKIESGSTTRKISNLLFEKGVIRSPLAFRIYAHIHGVNRGLQAGKFVIEPSRSVSEIADILHAGKSQEVSVTIPEGYSVLDIDHLLAAKGLSETGALLHCAQTCDFSSFAFLPKAAAGLAARGGKLEGYLFPNTYFADADGFVPKFFLERMLNAFRANVVEAHAADIAASGRSLHAIVTMASLIEEETRTDEERPIVSGILWKRLDGSRGLGVDATVRYILQKQKDSLTEKDLLVKSAYNTRKYKGLPPGPIANAGIKSIIAALKPVPSEYWYYLHDREGHIHYAKTNDEHNANRSRYLP